MIKESIKKSSLHIRQFFTNRIEKLCMAHNEEYIKKTFLPKYIEWNILSRNIIGKVECARGVMVKALGLRNQCKEVRTPVVLLRSLSDNYPWERYEPPLSS